jgi:RimJ/RimL family protein N-acetyltransferase
MAYQTHGAPGAGRPPLFATECEAWRQELPVLNGRLSVLREVRGSDSQSLLALLTCDEVTRYLVPPPPTIQGFDNFIGWALRQRAAGTAATFAVTLKELDEPLGLFQIRGLQWQSRCAEWGFAIGRRYWGTGIFDDAAALVLAFAFDTLGVRRLEARTAVANARGNGALRKVGAVLEGTLRGAFARDGEYADQALYSLLDTDWRRSFNCPSPGVSLVH